MKLRTTIILLVLVIAAGLYIAFVERQSETTQEREELARHALRLKAGEVKRISFVTEDSQVTCEKNGDEWTMTSPVKARADSGAIDAILFGLENLPKGEVITERQRRKRKLTLTDYGLDRPRVKISWATERAQTTMLVGRDTPLGANLYVKEEIGGNIIVTETNFLSSLPKASVDLRDHRLFTGFPANVARVDVRRKDGFVQLAKSKQDSWMIQKPFVARAAQESVQGLLDKLYNLRVESFVADSFAAASLYGLDEPAAQITVTSSDKNDEQVLLLGKPVEQKPGQLYVTLQGSEAVYAISDQILETLKFKLDDVRDRRLITLSAYEMNNVSLEQGEHVLKLQKDTNEIWNVVEPRQYKADEQRVQFLLSEWTGVRIESFTDDLATNLAEVGLDPPSLKLVFAKNTNFIQKAATMGVETQSTTETSEDGVIVFIGGVSSNDHKSVAKVMGEESLYTISTEPLNSLFLEPLFYRDHEVLALDPDIVHRLTVDQDNAQKSVERDGTNDFRSVGESTGVVDQDAVLKILEAVRSVRATDLVAEDAKSLIAYGLENPSATITFGLSGEAGISKSLLFGQSAGEESVYAMVKGQDLVFTLPKALRDKLLQPLYKEKTTTGNLIERAAEKTP